jgi:hypothetical protein
MPEDDPLILHVKGTESETTMLPKQVVKAALSQGQLTHSQLIWSPADNAWKQLREMPHLLPSQKLAPAPPPRVATGPLPKVVAVAQPQAGSVPRVSVSAATGTPKVSVAVSAKARPTRSLVVKDDDESHPLKWLCIGLGALIVGAIAVNYLLVDQPLVSSLGQTHYAHVTVYAHLGAYVQPNVVVIHIPASASVTSDNLLDFLVALAHSTPQAPMSSNFFERVALTSGWTASYSISGSDWKQFGDMGQDDKAQQKEFLMGALGDASGQSLMPPTSLNEEAQEARREAVWKKFEACFTQP